MTVFHFMNLISFRVYKIKSSKFLFIDKMSFEKVNYNTNRQASIHVLSSSHILRVLKNHWKLCHFLSIRWAKNYSIFYDGTLYIYFLKTGLWTYQKWVARLALTVMTCQFSILLLETAFPTSEELSYKASISKFCRSRQTYTKAHQLLITCIDFW